MTILGAFVAIIIFLLIIGLFSDSENESDNSEPSNVTDNTEKQEKDYSDLDLETLIGKTLDELEDIGFVSNNDMSRYELLDGKVYAEFDSEGKANRIVVTGTEEYLPFIHGIRCGMSLEEADELLKDTYESAGSSDGEKAYINRSNGMGVGIRTEDNKISELIVGQIPKEDLDEYLQQAYVFPYSDSQYLSEDEVRSVEVDMLAFGRNEIFARHGYIFEDDTYKQYFESMPWYEGSVPAEQFNADEVFNDFEKKNAELIKQVEDELNQTDNVEPFIGMDGQYQCGSSPEAGVIDIYIVDESTINVAFGTQAIPALIGGVGGGIEGSIVDSHTATVDLGDGCVFTLTWTDTGIFTISRTGSSGYAEIDAVTDGMEYVNAQYYQVS